MPSWLPRALVFALAACLLLEVVVIAPRFHGIVLAGTVCWLAIPGVFLIRQLFASREPASIGAWLFGPALGLGFSVFGVFLLWAARVQNWIALILGPLLTWGLVVAARRWGGPTLRLPAFTRRDIVAVTLALAIVPVVTWAPYDHIREPVADGEAYRAYFTADFVWAMTVTAELAKGDLPPHNPFLTDQSLHYYWMAHFLSGALYRNVRGWGVTAEQVILIDGLTFGLCFVAFLYGLARLVGAGPWASLLGCVAGFLANSYEGADMIRAIVQGRDDWSALTTVNIDAITRWYYHGMPVDGLQRLLLYQPHHLTGYVFALGALWLVSLSEDVQETSVALWAGIMLGLAVLFSSFAAILGSAAVALVFALRVVQQRAFRTVWQSAILGLGPCIVAVAVSNALGYTDSSQGSLLTFGLNPIAVHHLGWVLLLNFGPLVLVAVAAVFAWRWSLTAGSAPISLILVCFAFYFFANVPDSGGVWVGWRTGHMLLIAFAVTGAALLSSAWTRPLLRRVLIIPLAIALSVAVPTAAIDVYNAQDITNRARGPDFPWTLVITHDERAALEWIRRETPPEAVVQLEPYVRGSTHWSLLPAFAERRTGAGRPIAMIPAFRYATASDNVQWGIYRAVSAKEAHVTARFMKIDYIAAGPLEREAYKAGLAQIAASPDLFTPVFENAAMTIYRVR